MSDIQEDVTTTIEETRTLIRRRPGADGRMCQETVIQYLGPLEWIKFPNHDEDSRWSRRVVAEEVIAYSQCVAEEVTIEEFNAIRVKRDEQAHSVAVAAGEARLASSKRREDALQALAKNAGLTVEQTEALFGRSLSPVVKEVVAAVAKKR